MSEMNRDDDAAKTFARLCEKAVLYVTAESSNMLRIYFAPDAMEEATNAAPGGQEAELLEIRDPATGKYANYPYITYMAQYEEPEQFRASFERKKMHDTTELFVMKQLEAQGSLGHVASSGMMEDVDKKIEDVLRHRLHIASDILSREKMFLEAHADHMPRVGEKLSDTFSAEAAQATTLSADNAKTISEETQLPSAPSKKVSVLLAEKAEQRVHEGIAGR